MTSENSNNNRHPEYRLYHVVGQGESSIWTAIGAAWPHRDQQGFAISLNMVPLNGRIVMRAISEGTGGQQ